ncbi:hypothetical protein [Saccharomonospora xinjiangensis]|uniref:ATP/GTP-binding protein n=1 Tax=Saccharomonospora xinjiangensis XJ-54 TaxID=882086 RepID=I0V5M7_9PSEU|nr:hypothetical protein [Saccharomonospora xinjiangensis]EID55430.1 hypothetical protein SacxiDRAFT_3224 [Saccharomonospora xinjiangensis XJ-54]
MPRRNRARRVEPRTGSPGFGAGWARPESGPDGDWVVRSVPGAQATKIYRCPGCDHEIRPGVAHVVAWPAGEHGSVTDRRHWHQSCWKARTRRGPTRRRW